MTRVEVAAGIETDRGLWVQALVAAGYVVFGINPLQTSRYRERHGVSGGKSDTGDAHALADMVRTDSHQLRPVAGDSPAAQAVKVVARAHKTLIWERTRHVQRLRHQLRDFFPAALAAFDDLDAPDALELLARAPDPASAARLTTAQIDAALKRARRRDRADKTAAIRAALRSQQLAQPPQVTAASAAVVRSLIAVITTLSEQITVLQGQVDAHFSQHPDAEIILSQPGLGPVLGARVLAEFGDDPDRYASAKARKNYAATSPITRQSGKTQNRDGPVRAQRPAPRRPRRPGLRRPQRLARRPGLLRRPARPRDRATGPRCATSPTGSPASCTAASKPARATTRPPPGRSPPARNSRLPLDTPSSWDV